MTKENILNDRECTELFGVMDVDHDMNITIDELKSELRVINAAYIFAQIKENIAGSSKGKA
eukprot:CAMPEP_0116887436 /NCGR_PEP_ID=MMETSP0463-20121206/21919_1 /TAXON_ID=181622 /ORGANISM="Strombidinopsis sp, Strain SopsisLIS2011" /LENGTH=60 /DNA_ID=CAMNT_0004550121 /DNA_START=1503 /DNA_END=1685 /DNA_ORIENTATION=+